jgi:hypothetical protein
MTCELSAPTSAPPSPRSRRCAPSSPGRRSAEEMGAMLNLPLPSHLRNGFFVSDGGFKRAALLGETGPWQHGSGKGVGIDESGALLVDTDSGRMALQAGEVHLPRLRIRRGSRCSSGSSCGSPGASCSSPGASCSSPGASCSRRPCLASRPPPSTSSTTPTPVSRRYAQRIARVREFYVDVAPRLEPYLTIIRGATGVQCVRRGGSPRPSGLQLFLTIAGTVAVVNSVIVGAAAGIFIDAITDASPAPSVAVGVPAGSLAVALHMRVLRRTQGEAHSEIRDEMAVVAPARNPVEASSATSSRVWMPPPPPDDGRVAQG